MKLIDSFAGLCEEIVERERALKSDLPESFSRNFFGVCDWASTDYLGVSFSLPDAGRIPSFPLSENSLLAPCPFVSGKRVCETHFVFLGLSRLDGAPLTILEWYKNARQDAFCFSENPWFAEEPFASEAACGNFIWHVVLVDAIHGSCYLDTQDQLSLLPSNYRAPTPVEEVTKNVLFFLKNKYYPNRGKTIRCNAFAGNCGVRVGVNEDGTGQVIERTWDNHGREGIGMGAIMR